MFVCLSSSRPCSMLQGYNYEHLGGDLNEKLTDDAQLALDDAWNTVMEDFREAKRPSLKFSHLFFSPLTIALNFVCSSNDCIIVLH